MTIIKTKAYQTSNGNTYSSLELAQRAELFDLLAGEPRNDEQTATLCTLIYEKRDVFCEILRATGRKPRKVKATGATRKRKATAVPAE